MWNWKNQGSGEKCYNMSQNWGNPTTPVFSNSEFFHPRFYEGLKNNNNKLKILYRANYDKTLKQ